MLAPPERTAMTMTRVDDTWLHDARPEAFYCWDVADHFVISKGAAIQPEPESKGTTAPTACGLLRVATDGERIGRMGWVPGRP